MVLTGSPSDPAALETGFQLARLFGAHMDCLHVRPGPSQIIAKAAMSQFTATTGNVALIHAIERAVADAAIAARQAFDSFCGTRNFSAHNGVFNQDGVEGAFRQTMGDIIEKTITESRFNNLTILARGDKKGGLSTEDIGNVLVRAGRPVVLAPAIPPENIVPTIAIAWKEAAEAARAVAVAMPLLAKSDRVFVLAGDESSEGPSDGMESATSLVGHLQRNGIPAQAKAVLAAGRAMPDAILETAKEVGADLLISGAYGHSRAREWVFGGFTRRVIKDAKLPVLLFH